MGNESLVPGLYFGGGPESGFNGEDKGFRFVVDQAERPDAAEDVELVAGGHRQTYFRPEVLGYKYSRRPGLRR
ncbi:MAG: hypothetical protein ACR2GU_13375 [Rubrobacteraceae bacterium]